MISLPSRLLIVAAGCPRVIQQQLGVTFSFFLSFFLSLFFLSFFSLCLSARAFVCPSVCLSAVRLSFCLVVSFILKELLLYGWKPGLYGNLFASCLPIQDAIIVASTIRGVISDSH